MDLLTKQQFIKKCLMNPDPTLYAELLEKEDEIYYPLFSAFNDNKKSIEIPVRNKNCKAEGMTDLMDLADFIYSKYLGLQKFQCQICRQLHLVDINDYYVDSSFEYFLHSNAKKQYPKGFNDNSKVICKKSKNGNAPSYRIISLAYQDGS